MKSLVIYFSKFGHTKKVAEAIAEILDEKGEATAVSSELIELSDLNEADLVIMGCPTHKMNLPEGVRPVFDRLPRRVLKNKPVAAFDTSYKMSSWLRLFTASRRLAPKLRKMGGKLVLKPQNFYVVEREGPLYDGELERARAWAIQILESIPKGSTA